METALIAARFIHITALVMLFGAALFPFYAYNSGDPAVWPGGARLKTLHIGAALLALFGALAWFAFTTRAITGGFSPDALWQVAHKTQFGLLWSVRLLLLTFIALPLAFIPVAKKTAWIEMLTAGVLLATLAGTGHAQTGQTDVMHWGGDALHLLAAGAWIGGLLPLAFAVAQQTDPGEVVLRFSTMGIMTVATLVATGLINALYLVGSVRALFGTGYGQLLIIKLGLFGIMLMLAARNRFKLMPSLAEKDGSAQSKLIRTVLAEQCFGFCLLLAVAMLGTMEPAINAYANQTIIGLP